LRYIKLMSKVGEKPVDIPADVQIEIKDDEVVVRGPKGELKVQIPDKIRVSVDKDGKRLKVERESEYRKVKALHGLARTLINNAVQGVVKLWEKRLEVVGTGYNVRLEGDRLVFKLGFSHEVYFPKKDNIEFAVEKNRVVIIKGIDKQKVGEVAASIRSLKKPDAYKGKGIRYQGEVVKLKPGKKAKAG